VGHVFVESRDAFAASQMRDSFWYGAMNGAILAVGVYLLVIGLRMRETSMLWAAAFSVQLAMRNLGAVGVLHTLLLPSFPAVADIVLYGFQVVPVSLWLAFLVSWLELERHHPRWSRVLLLTAALLPMQGVLVILRGGFGWNIPMNISAAFPALFGIVIGVVFLVLRVVAGDRRARLYFLCWMPIAFGTLARLFTYFVPEWEIPLGPVQEPGFDMVVTVTAIAVLLTLTFRDREGRLRAVAEQHERRMQDYATIAGQGVVELDSTARVSHAIGPLALRMGLVAGVAADQVLAQERGRLLAPGTQEVARPEGWLSLTISPIVLEETGEKGSRLIITDVTEAVRARQTEGRRNTLAALGQLAGSVAHEVNNLLHPLINLTRWVQRTEALTPEGQRYLDLVATSGTRAGEIVAQVLQGYSPHNLNAPKLPLSQALRDAVATVSAGLPATIRLEVELADLPQKSVSAGEALQLLSNLLSNSLRAMQGAGTVWVRLGPEAGGGARLSLRDSGPGMPPDILARATEMFVTSRADNKGMGIGLAIVAEIAENWGARLEIRSDPGKGCEVALVWDGQGQEVGHEARSGG
jgi:signal transduction histidine kinase